MSSRVPKMGKSDLKIGWATHEACKYAVTKWHYSGSMPVPPIVKIGAWEYGRYIGCILFSRGASSNLLKPYGLKAEEGCELTRVALAKHENQTSRIVAIAIKFLKKINPQMRLIVSFADPHQGHHGGIYQAGGWIYAGDTAPGVEYWKNGRKYHSRQVSEKGWNIQQGKKRRTVKPSQCKIVRTPPKHRYLMPLDDQMRQDIQILALPYPKKRQPVEDGCTPAVERRGRSDPGAPLK